MCIHCLIYEAGGGTLVGSIFFYPVHLAHHQRLYMPQIHDGSRQGVLVHCNAAEIAQAWLFMLKRRPHPSVGEEVEKAVAMPE